MNIVIYNPVEVFGIGLVTLLQKNFQDTQVKQVLSHAEILREVIENECDLVIYDTLDYNRRYNENIIQQIYKSNKKCKQILFNNYELYLNLTATEIKRLKAVLRYDISSSDFIYVTRFVLYEENYKPKHINFFNTTSLTPKGFEHSSQTELSEQERLIAIEYYNGKTAREILEKYSLKQSTLNTIKIRIMRKLGVFNMQELKRKYIINNLLF